MMVKKNKFFIEFSSYFRIVSVLLVVVVMNGCASTKDKMQEIFGSYNKQSATTLQMLRDGNTQGALDRFLQHDEKAEKGNDKKALQFMEKGYIQMMRSDLSSAIDSWRVVDKNIQKWEENVRVSLDKVIESIGSLVINDKVRKYEPANYERVFLTTNIAVSHATKGNWDFARTEIKKTHEREAIISEYNAKKYAQVEEDEKESKQSVKSYKKLDGYPVEIFESNEVLSLRNSYQNVLSHYLAGFVYEALGENSLAAPGYRKAIELNPDSKILESGLANLESRGQSKKSKVSDVLFVIGSGEIANKKSVSIPVPLITATGIIIAPISFPIYETSPYQAVDMLSIDGGAIVPYGEIMNVDAMAIRELKDDMPGIILRTTIRAAAKAITQKVVQNTNATAGYLLALFSLLTESADERMWRTLPARVKIWRQQLPYGGHNIKIGNNFYDINIDSSYTVIPIRVIGNQAYLGLDNPTVDVVSEP